MEKKKHHYVPVAYLKGFVGEDGFLCVYRTGPSLLSLRMKPSEIAFRKFYYSQPLASGGHDNNRLENLFSTLETEWENLRQVLENRQPANHILHQLIRFVGFQRVRVPAFREAIEQAMANYAMGAFRELQRLGELPPAPPEHPNIAEMTVAKIDPHQSIHAMAQLLAQLAPFLDSLGYIIVENVTGIDFITSDNPVSYYSLDCQVENMKPYQVHPSRTAELVFPVSPTILILGRSDDRERFRNHGLKYVKWRDANKVRYINRMTARFAYEAIFSRTPIPPVFIQKYSCKSPVLDPNYPGFDPDHITMPPFVFGTRTRLPKWDRNRDYANSTFPES